MHFILKTYSCVFVFEKDSQRLVPFGYEDKNPHEIVEEWLDQTFLFSSHFRNGEDQKIVWKTESALRDLVQSLQDDKENMMSEADDLERDNVRVTEPKV